VTSEFSGKVRFRRAGPRPAPRGHRRPRAKEARGAAGKRGRQRWTAQLREAGGAHPTSTVDTDLKIVGKLAPVSAAACCSSVSEKVAGAVRWHRSRPKLKTPERPEAPAERAKRAKEAPDASSSGPHLPSPKPIDLFAARRRRPAERSYGRRRRWRGGSRFWRLPLGYCAGAADPMSTPLLLRGVEPSRRSPAALVARLRRHRGYRYPQAAKATFVQALRRLVPADPDGACTGPRG